MTIIPMASTSPPTLPSTSSNRPRLPRIVRACERCRARKVRCDGANPCSGCRQFAVSCVYRTSNPRKQKRKPPSWGRPAFTLRPQSSASVGVSPSALNEPAPIATEVSALPYPGRPVRRPVLSDPDCHKKLRELRAGIGVSNTDNGSFQYYGPSSHFCFVQKIYQRMASRNMEPLAMPGARAVPEGVQQWGLEQFIFSDDSEYGRNGAKLEAYFSRDMGISFIDSYFMVIHPQIPVLIHSEVMETWNSLCQPPVRRGPVRGETLLFMVLAIGARVSSTHGRQDSSSCEGWAKHFSSKARRGCNLETLFTNPSLRMTHLLLLLAVYAYQVMRPNDAYLYLEHAAHCAVALGINRAQVVDGSSPALHRLKLTFWTIYSQERLCALYTGRPSTFRDELIDAPYPEDLASLGVAPELANAAHFQASSRCGWVRAISCLGRVADQIFVGIYSLSRIAPGADLTKVGQTVVDCDVELDVIARTLPAYLHFFDNSLPIGSSWQEVQRVLLGNYYYMLRMLMHRPALVLVGLYNSRAEAEERAVGTMDVQESIAASTASAKSIINLNNDAFFHRCPELKVDGSLASFLISACVTLVYEALDPDIGPEYAKETFSVVDRGIQCLDQIEHVGATTGKALSLAVMQVAKDTLRSTRAYNQFDEDIAGLFPWLQSEGVEQTSCLAQGLGDSTISQGGPTSSSETSGRQYLTSLLAAPDVNHMSHWLDAGFDAAEVPQSLH